MANKSNTRKLLQELGAVTVALQRPTPLRLNLPLYIPRRTPGGAPPKRKRRIRIHSPGPDIPVAVPILYL